MISSDTATRSTATPDASRRSFRKAAVGWLMLAPVHAQLIFMLALPAVYVFWLSLNQSSYGGDAVFVGLRNYAEILSDPAFIRSLINTFVVVNIIVYAEIVLAVGAALLFQSIRKGKAIFLAVLIAPYAISEVVAVLAWRFMADPNVGGINLILNAVGLSGLSWATNPVHALGLASVISVWLHFPFSFLLIYGGLLGIPGNISEAARIDGATAWQRFRRITLPLLMPAILIAIVFRYIFAFRMFSEVWLLTQGGPARSTEVLSVYLYKNAFRFSEFGMAAATGWLMVLGSLALACIYLVLIYRQGFRNEN